MKKIIILLLIFMNLSQQLVSQNSTSTAGGNIQNANGTISYSIGLPSYTANTENDGSVTQGVQQPYEVSQTTFVINVSENNSLSIFPNPTSNSIFINLQDSKPFDYSIFDLNGKLLKKGKIKERTNEISLNFLSKNIYILKVYNNSFLYSSKIIKL